MARSLAEGHWAQPLAPPDTAYLEALADTDVLHYSLDVEVSNLDHIDNTCLLVGRNTMTIQSKSVALDEFSFRLCDIYSIAGAHVNETIPVAVTTTSETTRVVTLDRTYALDESFTLTIEYSGNTIPAIGPFWSGGLQVDAQPDDTPVAATRSQPYFAYSWWPVKEGDVAAPGDNSDKATLEISVTVPDPLIVASNGLLQSVDALPGDRTAYRWASNYAVIPSLVCFAATEFNTWTATYTHPGGSMPVEFFIYPAWDTAENRAAWEKSVIMLDTFAGMFGEYPFVDEKYGIYNFPWYGLEHQTMTGQGPIGDYTGFEESLSAHELAHQWWGDSVTCKTWNHIWLNESFATYADALWEEFKPGGGGLPALQAIMRDRKIPPFYPLDGSVYVYDEELGNPTDIFDPNTTYYKGSWILHMLRHMLGDGDFFDALRAYRAAFEFQAATTEDFQAVCESFYGGELDWFFQQWVYEEGSPIYDWGWDSVEVNGRHYVLLSIDQVQDESFVRFTMPIDVVVDGDTYVAFNDAAPQHFVIPVPSAPVSVEFDPDEWIHGFVNPDPVYHPGPPKIVETFPAPGEALSAEAVGTVFTITFHTTVDVDGADISLSGVETGPVSFVIAADTDVNPLVLNLSEPLAPDAYTLTIGANGVVAVNSGLALDGEIGNPNAPASLPSGDGVPGGDALIAFTVLGDPVPTTSVWGLVALMLLILVAGTVLATRRFQRQ